ncbi:MAG: CDP-glycerol glycerophosphotransferase family protein [Ferrimonas sp.]
MRIAFLVWNKFQINHFSKLFHLFDDVTLIIERRDANDEMFTPEELASIKINKLYVHKNKIKNIDGLFDMIFCQTVFPQIEHITKSKIAMMQYGLAKENHNYGTWRSFADVIFSYGDYSKEKLSYFAPSFNVGHPNAIYLNDEEKKSLKINMPLDLTKKTILYSPTWGDLSSFELFFSEIEYLGAEYNVILKLHHNTMVPDFIHGANVINATDKSLCDLIQISDLVISDYSGAIFDAMFFHKPIVLCQHLKINENEKVGFDSAEFYMAKEIGRVATSPNELKKVVSDTFVEKHDTSLIRGLFFSEITDEESSNIIKKAVVDCVGGFVNKSQGQRFVEQLARLERKERFLLKKKI